MLASPFVTRVSLLRDEVDAFDRYPFSLPVLRDFDAIDLHPKVTFLIGENGSGKSTLLEAIAVSLGFNDDTEHFQVTRDFLANPQRMLRVLLER